MWDGTGTYLFNGGTLSASNMELFAEWTIGSSAQAGRISNPGWLKLGFTTLHIGDADEHLGRFILVTNAIDTYAPPAPVKIGRASCREGVYVSGVTECQNKQ